MYDRKRVLALIIIIIAIIIAAILIYSALNTNQNPQPGGPQIVVNNSTNPSNGTAGVVISIQNMTFTPNNINIKTGTNIQWINRDNTQHQVVSDSGVFQSPVLTNGSTYSFYFAKSGVYGYHCGIHPGETGTIIVQD